MRAVLLPCLLALAWAPAQAARWLPVTESSVRAVYLDTAGAVREGALVRTWIREVYTNEQRADQVGVMYYAANTLMSYDCTRRTLSALFRVFYGSDGTELRRIALDAVDVPTLASPGSLQEALLERACSALVKPKKDENVPDGLLKVAATQGPANAAAAKEASKPDPEKAAGKGTETNKPEAAAAAKPEGEGAKPAKAAAKPEGEGTKPATAAAPKPQVLPEKVKTPAHPQPGAPVKLAPKDAQATAAHGKPAEAIKLPPTPARYALYEPPRRPKPGRTEAERRAKREPKIEPAQEHEVQWSYSGPTGADNWGKLKSEFAACATGKRQSPIDIRDGAKLELEPIKFDYKPSPLHIVDNGHTVQVNYAEGSSISVAGERYELKQFHFHKPSEERINGRVYDLVAHLVHQSTDGRLAVIAVLFESGPAQNAFIKALWPHLPLEAGREIAPLDVVIDINELLPTARTYYAYMGSLTTPPCTEGVLWLVMKNSVPINAEQVGVFGKLYALNARPVQPGNGRLIKESM
jgi:carbonic anhydrase